MSEPNPPLTRRAQERRKEERRFTNVIVKRNDESVRHPDDVLEKSVLEGQKQLGRPFISLFLSAISAGLILGFAALSVALVVQITGTSEMTLATRLQIAFVYPLGFIICVMSGTQLFTEHTALAVYPVLDRRSSVWSLLRLWAVVFTGNIFGALISSWILSVASPVTEANAGYAILAEHLISASPTSMFVSALLAGWLMAQGGWLILATPPSVAQIVCIYIVTFIIGLGGLHHSIAGASEVLTAWFLHPNEFSLKKIAQFLVIAGSGNLVGGSIMVAFLNYGHIRKTQEINPS